MKMGLPASGCSYRGVLRGVPFDLHVVGLDAQAAEPLIDILASGGVGFESAHVDMPGALGLLTKVDAISTRGEAFALLVRVLTGQGFSSIRVGELITQKAARRPPMYFSHNDGQPAIDWANRYRRLDYVLYDPIVDFFRRTGVGAATWSEILAANPDRVKKGSTAARIMHESAQHGLHEGLAIAIPGAGGLVVGASLAGAERCIEGIDPDERALIDHLTRAVLWKESSLFAATLPGPPVLPQRLEEIASGLIAGKSYDQIANDLKMNKKTVANRVHRDLFPMFQAKNIVELVARLRAI